MEERRHRSELYLKDVTIRKILENTLCTSINRKSQQPAIIVDPWNNIDVKMALFSLIRKFNPSMIVLESSN